MADVVVNGKSRPLPDAATLAALVADLGFDGRYLVAEVNGEPVAASEFPARKLRAGDRVELVRPVAGG